MGGRINQSTMHNVVSSLSPQTHEADIANLVNKAVASLLDDLSCRSVAWSGRDGQIYYKNSRRYSRSLAKLSALAEQDIDLLLLVTGWLRARAQWKEDYLAPENPLIVIASDLPPKMLSILEHLQANGVELIVILLDSMRRYVSNISESFRNGLGWPGPYAASRGLTYSDPIEATSPERMRNALKRLLSKRGVRILHIIGPLVTAEKKQEKNKPFPAAFSRAAFAEKDGLISKDIKSETLENAAINLIANDLASIPEVIVLWARSASPEKLAGLGRRLQRSSLDGLLLQAVGMAASGCHPLIIMSASSIPRILPDLMDIEPFPISFIIMNSGLNHDEISTSPLNAAKILDLALLRCIPEVTIAVPAHEIEARIMMKGLLASPKPGVLRLTKAPAIGLKLEYDDTIIKQKGCCLREGSDISFLCLGSSAYLALLAAETVNSWGYSAGVYNFRYLEPIDEELLQKAAACGRIITVEEHCVSGGFATKVFETLTRTGHSSATFSALSAGVHPDIAGSNPEDHGLSINGLVNCAKNLLGLNDTL